jgi:hypothetical protein
MKTPGEALASPDIFYCERIAAKCSLDRHAIERHNSKSDSSKT